MSLNNAVKLTAQVVFGLNKIS